MKLEIEAVFLDIDKEDLRRKLQALGAKLLVPERKMVRTVFNVERPHTFLRVRDEGDEVVVTYKEVHDGEMIGTKEINIVVDSYDAAVEMFRKLGLKEKAYQETLRESWELDGAEIDIDTWPWLPTYVEVEGTSAENMVAVAEKLGFDMENAIYGAAGLIYEHYYNVSQDDVNSGRGEWRRLELAAPVPEWLAQKKR